LGGEALRAQRKPREPLPVAAFAARVAAPDLADRPRAAARSATRILVMKRCDTRVREAFALHVPRPIGRVRQRPLAGSGARLVRRDPAGLVRRGETRVVVERADLPRAAFLRVLDEIDALRPHRGAAVLAEHHERTPAALRRLAAGIEVHDRLDAHVVVEPAVAEPGLAHLAAADVEVQMTRDAFLADV